MSTGGQAVISTPECDLNWAGRVSRRGPGWVSSPTGRRLLRKQTWEQYGLGLLEFPLFLPPAHLLPKQ